MTFRNASLFAAVVLAITLVGAGSVSVAVAEVAEAVLLESKWRPGDVAKVVASFEVGGDLLFDEKGEEKKTPMSVVAKLEYAERLLPPPGESNDKDNDAQSLRSLRQYEAAKATIKIAKSGVESTLDDAHQTLVVDLADGAITFVDPDESITREVVDLVDLPASTLVVDRLLPGETKKVGETWAQEEQTMQAILGLDAVAVCEVESLLVDVENGYAKIKLAGSVQGAVDGVATEIEVNASYLYHVKLGRILRMNFASKEKRGPGPVGAGVDVVSKLKLAIDPIAQRDAPAELSDAAVASLPASFDALIPITQTHATTGMQFTHNRHWYTTSDQREQLILRYVDGGELLAQCQVSVLPRKNEADPPTLEKFQKDVQFALDKRLDQILNAREWETAAGMSAFRVIASGQIKETPIEWRYYLLTDATGRRIAVTVTVEGGLVERLGNAEQEIIESLTLPAGDGNATEQAKRDKSKSTSPK